jgi:hypothetical protein
MIHGVGLVGVRAMVAVIGILPVGGTADVDRTGVVLGGIVTAAPGYLARSNPAR